MSTRRIVFQNASGQRLAARLEEPSAAAPEAFALFAHCFTCSKNQKAVTRISRSLCSRGIAVLRFDFTGLGASEGDFADTNLSSNVSDLVEAAAYLERHFEAPKILIGHSLGGAAVLQAAGRIPSARAVATIAAPYEPSHVAKHFGDARTDIEQEGEAEVTIGGRPFRVKKQFLDDLAAADMEKTIRNLGRALLVFHSPRDRVVGIENAQKIFVAAMHPKSFVSLDRADHLLSDDADAAYVAAVVSEWARKYIGTRKKLGRAEQEPGVIVWTGSEAYPTDIASRTHCWTADEPTAAGGMDTGPTPYELLLSALGACTAITLRMYANRRQWPLDSVEVRLQHEKIHAADCDECETRTGYVDRIEREITLLGPLDDAQRRRLLEIADRCPVHRTLHAEVQVRSTLTGTRS